jgi:hypothetical protein
MGGGLLQLIAVGQIDQFLSINPELSFYQYVYKKHTNFAMESRELSFQKNPELSPSILSSTYECVVSRYGDLLSELYFCYTLPDIYSSDIYRFRWVKNVGSIFIKKATIFIDGTMIDQTTGEWMNIWNELTLPSNDTRYDKMFGNVSELTDPKMMSSRVTIKNNKFIFNFYPSKSKTDNEPSIKSRKIIVPLNFWFTKNPSLALPLLRLQFNIITIKLETESSENLYQVWSKDLNRYVSPLYYNELYNDKINIYTFANKFSISPYIEANYVFLADEERNTLFLKPKLTYMVEQLTINSTQSISSTSTAGYNINVIINNPTKEIVWITRRDDYLKYNEHNNYSADNPETNNGILEKAMIKFNSNNRIDEKNAEYFNMIQPYQHHTKIPKQGIYCYSFALYPEKEFLSGYYNAALVKTNLLLYVKNDYNNNEINSLLVSTNRQTYNVNYLVNVYSINYNIFEIVGSQSGMKFTLSS